MASARVKQIDSAINWILSILQKQKQHVSVMGSNTWLNMGLMPFHIYAYNGVWLWCMSLPVKWQEQSYCSCLCISASQMITLLWFWKRYVSTVYLYEYLRFLTLVKQKFDRLLFCIICHGTYPVLWCLSPQVLDQKNFAAPKELYKFSLVRMLTLDGFGRPSETFLLYLESYLVYEKEYEVGHCHQLCLQLVVVVFYVSTLKQALK